MINANDLYTLVKFFANQNQTGRITPSEFNAAWAAAERELLNEKIGDGTRLKVGAQGRDQRTQDELDFLRRKTVVQPDSLAEADLPADYHQLNAIMRIDSKTLRTRVSLLNQDKWAERTSSKLLPVSSYPIAQLVGQDKVQILPSNYRYEIHYLKKPTTPSWAFTTDANGRPVYDAGNSVNSEFPESLTNDVAFKICSYLGINISRVDLIQYSESKQGI